MGRLIVALKEIVLDYNPSTHLLRRVLKPRPRHDAPIPVEVSRLVIQAKTGTLPKTPSSLSA
jgi:hypothetical protein